jgi:hypothetical protein
MTAPNIPFCEAAPSRCSLAIPIRIARGRISTLREETLSQIAVEGVLQPIPMNSNPKRLI